MLVNRTAALLILGSCWVTAANGAAAPERGPEAAPPRGAVPEGLQVEWRGTLTQTEDGTATFEGPVTMTWKDTRIQGDRMSIRERRYLEVAGNALIVWGRTRVFGRRMTYDLETERGVIEDAMGQTLDEYVFWAKSVEKIGGDKIHLRSATVTTCTQPVPYWSFSVSSATIHIDEYARMWNVRLRAGPVPVIYLPFMFWPVKQDRAPGLLMPELHTSRSRGQMYRQELFLPIGRSADLTLDGRYYTKAGFGAGGEFRAIPNQNGRIDAEGFYIYDKVYAGQNPGDGDRYQTLYRQEQRFLNGFRMVADVDVVSDASFLSDYERDLNVASTPQTLARLEFSRNGPWVSMNVRELRREQLSSGLVQQTLPEVELRGRSRQLAGSPVYLSFEASAASIQQRAEASPGKPSFRPDYLRGDLLPTLSLPWSPTTWLDITPQVSQRLTYYTQRQVTLGGERLVADRGLTRSLGLYGLEIVGPKVSRIFNADVAGASRFKHAIEPRIRYDYRSTFDDALEVLPYDEIDRVNGNGQQVNYAVVQRLFARRPRATQTGGGTAESIILPDGTSTESHADEGPTAPAADALSEPWEIAELTIGQTRAFGRDLSRADVDGDDVQETSPYSPIQLTGRYSPSPRLSLDLRSEYNILFDTLSSASLSGTLQNQLARMRFSVVHNTGLGTTKTSSIDPKTGVPTQARVNNPDSTQVRLTTGLSLIGGKMLLNVDGSYTANPALGTSHFPDQRWQVQYSTQCCTLFVERLTRDFAASEDRRELYFRVDLRGVGKILSSTF